MPVDTEKQKAAYAAFQQTNLASQNVALQTGQTQEIKTAKDQLGNTSYSYEASTPNPYAIGPGSSGPSGGGGGGSPVKSSSPVEAPASNPFSLTPEAQKPSAQQPQRQNPFFPVAPNDPNVARQNRLGEEANRKITADAFQAAQRQAERDYLSTGKTVTLDSDRISAAREAELDKYVIGITPGYGLLGGGSRIEVAPQKTYSIPVRDTEAEGDALRENYAAFSQADLKVQAQALGAQKNADLQQANVDRYNQSLQQLNKHVTVELGDTLGLNSPAGQASRKKEPEFPHETFQPNLAEQVWRGTVGHLGEFAADVFSFNSKLAGENSQYGLGAKKTAQTIRDATSLQGLAGVYDVLGKLTGNQSYKDYAAHAKHESKLESGEASGGAISELVARGQQATGYGADKNTNDSVAALQKQRTERPVEYFAASFTDITPVLLGIGGGKGSGGGKASNVSTSVSERLLPKAAGYSEPAPVKTTEPAAPTFQRSVIDLGTGPVKMPEPMFRNTSFNLGSGGVKTPEPTFKNLEVGLGRGPGGVKETSPARTFVNESVDLGTGTGRLTQIPEFKNITVDLGRSSSTGLGEVGAGGGGKPSGGSKLTPSQSIRPEDFGYKEVPGSDGTVTLIKLAEPTTITTTEPQATTLEPSVQEQAAPSLGLGNTTQIVQSRIDQMLKKTPGRNAS